MAKAVQDHVRISVGGVCRILSLRWLPLCPLLLWYRELWAAWAKGDLRGQSQTIKDSGTGWGRRARFRADG